jgi:SAM-dependent methyltransferase
MEYNVHNVQWTGEKIGRFWDWENYGRKNQDAWFTLQVGDAIWNISKKYIPIKSTVLDYSAGHGFMAKYILENSKNIRVDCAEQSEEGINNEKKILSPYKNFGKAIRIKEIQIDTEAHFYDAIYFNATIEHMSDNYLFPTLQEFKRLLRAGGSVIVTTDNDEDLERDFICCPDCGCVFHRVQHVRSFTKESLSNLMESQGFTTFFVDAVDLAMHKNHLPLKRKVFNLLKRMHGSKKPHLIYIGKLL